MLYLHQVDSLCYPLWLIPINGFRPAGCYGTEATRTSADITKNHERSCTLSPALAHVRAVAAFADGVELMGINKGTDVTIAFTSRETYSQPVRLLYTGGIIGY